MKKLISSIYVSTFALLAFVTPVLAQTSSSASGEDGIVVLIVMAFYCAVCLLILLSFAALIYFIVDATKRDYGEDQNMLIVGILLLLLLGFPIGMILYYFIIMQKYPLKN